MPKRRIEGHMEQSDPLIQKAKRYRYHICLIIFLSYVLVIFHRLCPAVIALDMQSAFHVSSTLLGVLGSAYFYPYAIMQLPVGLLADSWGPRKTVSAFFLVAAGGSILMGMASTLGLAILGRVMVGVGVSTVFVCNFKLLAEWFSPRKFVVMGGLFMATGGVGALISAAPLAWMSDHLGWRMSLAAVGGLTFVMAILVYLRVRNSPRDMGLPPLHRLPTKEEETRIGLLAGMKQVATARRFWPISFYTFFAVGLSLALGALWGGPYLMQVHGMSKTAAGGILSSFAVAMIVGSPVLAFFANRLGRKPVLIGSSICFAAVCGAFTLWVDSLSHTMLIVLFFCAGFVGVSTGNVVATVSKELFPHQIAGTAVGLVNLFPFFGGALFQIVMGALVSFETRIGMADLVSGYRMMFLFVFACAVANVAVSFFVTETYRRS